GLRAPGGQAVADRHGAQRRQWVRRLPERHRAALHGGGPIMSSAPVITGMGVVAPNGVGVSEFWAATRAGPAAIRVMDGFDARGYPSRLAGEVRGFDAEALLPSRLLAQTDHMTRLALVAAEQALADAAIGPDTYPSLEMGVVTASSAG